MRKSNPYHPTPYIGPPSPDLAAFLCVYRTFVAKTGESEMSSIGRRLRNGARRTSREAGAQLRKEYSKEYYVETPLRARTSYSDALVIANRSYASREARSSGLGTTQDWRARLILTLEVASACAAKVDAALVSAISRNRLAFSCSDMGKLGSSSESGLYCMRGCHGCASVHVDVDGEVRPRVSDSKKEPFGLLF
eukprot:4926617-Pyramimonas_sp.AAC.1